MHSSQRLALRLSCTARNAYSPSSALQSAFFAVPSRSYASASKRQRSTPVQSRDLLHESEQLKQAVNRASSLSTGNEAKTTAQQPQVVNRLGVGGTYGNYEALKGNLSPARNTRKSSAQDAPNTSTERVEQEAQQSPVRRVGDGRERARKAHRAQVAKKTSDPPTTIDRNRTFFVGDANTKDWQKHMVIIARRANELTKSKVDLKDTAAIDKGREMLNYIDFPVDAPNSPLDRPLPVPWALDYSESVGKTGMQLLEQEIEAFADHVACTGAEKVAREAVITQTIDFVGRCLFPNVTAELFGSETTGLAMSTSDVDIRLTFDVEASHIGKEEIRQLSRNMLESSEYILVVFRHAKFPIITAQHKETGIDIQIVASPSTAPQQIVTAQYLQELPHLRSLYMLLRTAFGIRGLADVFNGGTGSYGLLMMLAAALRRRGTDSPTTAAEQLLRFLNFYAELDTEKYGVSVAPPKLFKKHEAWDQPAKQHADACHRRGDHVRAGQWAIGQTRLFQPYMLCLQDPANPINDLGRKSNAIKHIQKTIRVLRNTLVKAMQDVEAAAKSGGPKNQDSILLSLVGRCHELHYKRRKRVEEYGMDLMMRQELQASAPEVEAKKVARTAA